MSDPKRTPGPWLFRGKSSTVHAVSETHPFGEQIFGFHDQELDDRTPSDADLALILAAPDLLAALIELEAGSGASPGANKKFAKARAAISKATA
jgi:hypothetical protein